MLLRMLNDPCQSETGRQMARANPQYICWYAQSQEPGAALARGVKSSTTLQEIILFDSRATRGNVGPLCSPAESPHRGQTAAPLLVLRRQDLRLSPHRIGWP